MQTKTKAMTGSFKRGGIKQGRLAATTKPRITIEARPKARAKPPGQRFNVRAGRTLFTDSKTDRFSAMRNQTVVG